MIFFYKTYVLLMKNPIKQIVNEQKDPPIVYFLYCRFKCQQFKNGQPYSVHLPLSTLPGGHTAFPTSRKIMTSPACPGSASGLCPGWTYHLTSEATRSPNLSLWRKSNCAPHSCKGTEDSCFKAQLWL